MNNILPEFTVSEISAAIKRALEDGFSCIKVKGEISGFKAASSGHLYFSIKDSNAVLNCVCWRGKIPASNIKLEDGLEVVCSGSITTYPGRSYYQLVVENIQPAGVGALLALLEKRKQAFAEVGFFALERKKPLPFLPQRIGIITSPSGAVIRDILHRIEERCPTEVLIWGTLVQGAEAAKQVAAAIRGFNSLAENRPDVIIVARGGGSIEDLWAFNEEEVLYAAVESTIPIISAIGHETDTTLLDFVADKRAPTPTAAAEMAVPLRTEILHKVQQFSARVQTLINYHISLNYNKLNYTEASLQQFNNKLQLLKHGLDSQLKKLIILTNSIIEAKKVYLFPKELIANSINKYLKEQQKNIKFQTYLLNAHDYKNVLKRGYAILRSPDDKILQSCQEIAKHQEISAELHDGCIKLVHK